MRGKIRRRYDIAGGLHFERARTWSWDTPRTSAGVGETQQADATDPSARLSIMSAHARVWGETVLSMHNESVHVQYQLSRF